MMMVEVDVYISRNLYSSKDSIVVLCIELLELLELSGFNDAIVPQVEKLDSIHLSQGSALFKLEEVGELRIECGSVSLDIYLVYPQKVPSVADIDIQPLNVT